MFSPSLTDGFIETYCFEPIGCHDAACGIGPVKPDRLFDSEP